VKAVILEIERKAERAQKKAEGKSKKAKMKMKGSPFVFHLCLLPFPFCLD